MRRTRNRLADAGVGNYWSDARSYDLDADGLGDTPYHPVSLFAFVSKQYPDLTVFAGSPAVLALDLAQRSLPALQLTDLVDPHPQMQPVTVPRFTGPDLPGNASGPGGAEADRLPLVLASLTTAGGGILLLRRAR
jgi:hypothetical protein